MKAACITYASAQVNLVSNNSFETKLPLRHEKILRAFIDAVVPGCDLDNINHLSGFYDESLPMAKYVRLLILRINRMKRKLGFYKRFYHLSREERTRIIEYGYKNSKLDYEMFHAAIYLSQITVYGGIFNQMTNADFIGFEGSVTVEPHRSTWHYTDLEGLEIPLTINGNYH